VTSDSGIDISLQQDRGHSQSGMPLRIYTASSAKDADYRTWRDQTCHSPMPAAKRYTDMAQDSSRTSPKHPSMRRSLFISLLAALAISVSVGASPMAAEPVHHHHQVHSKAHAAAHTASKVRGRAHGNAHHPREQAEQASESTKTPSSRASRNYAAASSRRLRGQTRGRQTRAAMRRRIRLARSSPEVVAARLNIPPPLRGSHESLVHQNEMAEADGLERILDDADLEDRIAHGSLVPVPVSAGLHVNTDLPENRRYCRPWTAKFLTDLAHAHSQRFSASAIEVTSAVRTVAYQRQLRRINGNAAAADGDIASPHLTGGTIDIAKQGLSAREIGWIRAWLIPLEQQGKIDVEEEFRQSCFHISVYKSYTEPKPNRSPIMATPMDSASVVAAPGQ